MTGRLLTMSDPPPPTNPPPGWYPDPSGEPGHRWWDGLVWTDSVSTPVGAEAMSAEHQASGALGGPTQLAAPTSPIGVFGQWFSESFRLVIDRSGHFLPMILLFVITISLPTSFAIWYALRDTVILFDPATATPDIVYGGSRPWLYTVLATIPLTAVLSFVCKASVARQAWAAQAGEAEPWSASVAGALRRWPRVVGFPLLRATAYWVVSGVFLLAIALNPGFILMMPFLAVALVFFWVRFSFVGTVAALGDAAAKPFAESWRVSGLQFGPLMGRLLVLGFVAINLILALGIIGAPFTAIAGAGGTSVEPTADTLRLNDLLGDNVTVFALGSLFNAIGLGAHYVLVTVGTTLLYRNLGGPVAAADSSNADSGSNSQPESESESVEERQGADSGSFPDAVG